MSRFRGENNVPSRFDDLFQQAVEDHADAVAAICGDESLSYRELNARSNQLARYLIGQGAGPETIVALSVTRSMTLLVATIAVLKSGAAYLPIDPRNPRRRLAAMCAEAEPIFLLSDREDGRPPGGINCDVVTIDELRLRQIRESVDARAIEPDEYPTPTCVDDLLYIVYTSGSTGKPKGVMITHRGLADLRETQRRWFGPQEGDRVLQWAEIYFDAAFWDISFALFSGATLVMIGSGEMLPGPPLHHTLRKYDIRHAVLPPAALAITDSHEVLVGGTLMSTGDRLTPELVERWAEGRKLFNGYGPTEVTVGATISEPIRDVSELSIGTPWVGGVVHILDDRLDPVPAEREGELFLGGSGLARGYLNRSDLTAERFVANPFGPEGSRLYRTGDRGHRDREGRLHFTGRTDDQVKIRGLRVELGEVEAALSRSDGVALAAAVTAGELASARIVAYVAGEQRGRLDPHTVQTQVRGLVPDYMVPSDVIVIDEMPMTPNGKIDRRRLSGLAARRSLQPPRSDEVVDRYDSLVRDIVSDLLGRPDVSLSDNLFELGGNSIFATSLAARLKEHLGVSVPMRVVLEAATLGDIGRQAKILVLESDHDTVVSGATARSHG
jgi:amino acid adenylation domain-containing protein